MKAEDRTLERGHHCLSKLSGDWKQGDVLTIIAFSDPKVLYENGEGEAVQHTALRALSHQYGHVQKPWMCTADSGAQPDACLDVLQYGAKYLCRWNPKWSFGGAVHCPSGVMDRLMMKVRNNMKTT
ncbi:hypothetical protein CYMTET_16016 [Cymbomonas tetramitiformis]|uniref:Uncharacterized protein n=1 Tax=Cymbomonas tetramitiformis TaxID=36881 RepID=A0AAE0GD18_9CHLO|nr:hypothetical protein CYMTET_16016 [Cymbomonas tetramitiformis]